MTFMFFGTKTPTVASHYTVFVYENTRFHRKLRGLEQISILLSDLHTFTHAAGPRGRRQH